MVFPIQIPGIPSTDVSDKNRTRRKQELGQVWTPSHVASHMTQMLLEASQLIRLDDTRNSVVRVLDPCVGPGTFLHPLFEISREMGLQITVQAIDVDGELIHRANHSFAGLPVNLVQGDYLSQKSRDSYDAIIMNPPYVRQEWLTNEQKARYRQTITNAGLPAPAARSNLYAYFLMNAIADLDAGGVLCAIVYSSLFATQYGNSLWADLNRYMDVGRIENLQVPFDSKMIDAEIFIARKRAKPLSDAPSPSTLDTLPNGYTRIRDLATVRRGTDLINRKKFVVPARSMTSENTLPLVLRTPPVNELQVGADAAILLHAEDTEFPQNRIKSSRILFNYYLRNHPRHLWNGADCAASDNFLLIQSDTLPDEALWLFLNSSEAVKGLLSQSKPQGAGLRKLQVYQYRNAIVPDWRQFGRSVLSELHDTARALIDERADAERVRQVADEILGKARP